MSVFTPKENIAQTLHYIGHYLDSNDKSNLLKAKVWVSNLEQNLKEVEITAFEPFDLSDFSSEVVWVILWSDKFEIDDDSLPHLITLYYFLSVNSYDCFKALVEFVISIYNQLTKI